MKNVKSKKTKITLSVDKEYAYAGKEKSTLLNKSLSQVLKDRIQREIQLEKQKNHTLIKSLRNLVAEDQKRNVAVDWKNEIREAFTKKNG